MNAFPLYFDRMLLQDRTIFAPENKADISFFGSGIEKIHIYQTNGGSNTYCSKTGVVGRICKKSPIWAVIIRLFLSVLFLKGIMLRSFYWWRKNILTVDYIRHNCWSDMSSTYELWHGTHFLQGQVPQRIEVKFRCLYVKKNYNTSTYNFLNTINENSRKILTSYYFIVLYF